MEIKLFGKQLFSATNRGQFIYNTAVDKLKEAKHLIDFYQDTGRGRNNNVIYEIVNAPNGGAIAVPKGSGKKKTTPKKVESKIELTPRGVYNLKMLNDEGFQIKADPKYVDEQLEDFKTKLSMIKTSEFDMNYGTTEIGSIISRFENRKKYSQFKDFYDQFPYTTTTKIDELTKNHDYLKLGKVEQFLVDMPKEATQVMKDYTAKTSELCEKSPVFYIIAKKKDFEKTERRRDPILLAQSPFGHFWQILGAWDSEMLLIEEL